MMAVDLHDRELLLPAISSDDQYFTLFDGLLLDNNSNSNKPINQNASNYLFRSASDSGSDLSSPIGSDQLSSTSTENSEEEEEDEEDDYIGELTRQMAQYMLQDEDIKQEKSWGFSGSPESVLWSHLGSNLDSPIGPSSEPSPPLTTMIGNFEKMKIINEEPETSKKGEKFISSSHNSIQESWGNPNSGFQSKQAIINDQIRAIQFYKLKQKQAMKQTEQNQKMRHYQSKGRVFGGFNTGEKLAPNSNNLWCNQKHQHHQSNQQLQPGSDMRAVFLNASGSRNVSSGTGVFLPRGVGAPREPRKKQGRATVLIPARVAQALKLHYEKTGVPSRFTNSGFPLQHDACLGGRNTNNNSMYSQQKGQSRTLPMDYQDMGLPQEWTY